MSEYVNESPGIDRRQVLLLISKETITPKTAQILARHSDIRLTLNIYTHVDQEEQIAAINALPGVPGMKK